MNLIFNEYIEFLKQNKVDIPELKEGYYWLDRQIIKYYDKQGILHKIARLYVDEDMNITYKIYTYKPFEIESWQETVKRNIDTLKELESKSHNLIKNMLDKYKEYEPIILTSGGKDSSVTMHLVRDVKPNIKCIFNNTTLDCADTYRHVKTVDNIEIITPKFGFYQWVNKSPANIPSRIHRTCCSLFKENITIDKMNKEEKYLFFMGMRNQESNTRSGYGDEIKNPKWRSRDWLGILPIREWFEKDIWLYILWRGIDINSKYKKGYSRVGCNTVCPYYNKSTWVLDRYWYPTMYNRWQEILIKDFVENFKWTRLNCTLKEYMTNWNGGLLREEPTQEVINEFAYFKKIKPDVASKYFNKDCAECGKKVNKKDEIGMNLKFLGRQTQEFYCKKHLIEVLDMSKEQWDEYIKSFKSGGCDLF